VKFSVRVNNDLSVAELGALAVAAETAGFDQVWVSNDLFLRSAPVLAATLAARTSRIALGIGVMNPYSVHPAELAMMAATLQEASGGRFLLGIGAGAEQFLGWAGIPRTAPLATTMAAVATVRALLGHHDVDPGLLPGWAREHADAALKFPQASPVPVYVGAMGPRMLAMAGAHADGGFRCPPIPARHGTRSRRNSPTTAPRSPRRCSPKPGSGRRISTGQPGSRTPGSRPPRSSTTGCCRSASPGMPPR
jgi:5,10-methylenetetrahydromethanopterin reductase